jgi:hypothetical protein
VCSLQVCVVVAILLFGKGGVFGSGTVESNWACLLGCMNKALQSAVTLHAPAMALRLFARLAEAAMPAWAMEHILPGGAARELMAGVVSALWEFTPQAGEAGEAGEAGKAGKAGEAGEAGGRKPSGIELTVGVDAAARAAFRLDEGSSYNEPCEAVGWMLGIMRHARTVRVLEHLTRTICVGDGRDLPAAVLEETLLEQVHEWATSEATAPASVRRLGAWCPMLFRRLVRYGVYGACLARQPLAGPVDYSRVLVFILRSESPVMYAALRACYPDAVPDPVADVEQETEDKLERRRRKAAFREEQAKRKLVG